ncbi:MAG TPA: L,D-transpeptidase [Myxococcales bacterium]|jgi:murein L,D-transpeptidase YafK
MLETLAMSALMLAVATQQPEAFGPEICAKSTAGSCEAARSFVERAKGGKVLVAFKAARLLYLFEDGKPVDREVDLKDYDPLIKTSVKARLRFPVPMALSKRAVGHKLRLADARTPEGEYEICGSIAASEYTYFLSVSFPAQKDVDAAVKEKRFDEKALARIKKSQHLGACPDFYSALGGTIGIHGAPTRMAKDIAKLEAEDPSSIQVTESDWTLGCLGVENRHIRFLAKEVPLRTKILIVP